MERKSIYKRKNKQKLKINQGETMLHNSLKLSLICALTALVASISAAKDQPVKERVVKVKVTEKGFVPPKIQVKTNEKLTLKITRLTDKTCMTELKNMNGEGETELPLNQETTFEVGTFNQPKSVQLLCGMEMVAGVVTIK
jgi:plastocyanin domain-containing protein